MIKKIILVINLLFISIATTNIYADNQKPVMIIRLNSDNIQYQSSLQMLIKNVKKNNPNIKFNIMVISTNNSQLSKKEAMAISQELVDNGIERSNITISSKEDKNLASDEIHIYATN